MSRSTQKLGLEEGERQEHFVSRCVFLCGVWTLKHGFFGGAPVLGTRIDSSEPLNSS